MNNKRFLRTLQDSFTERLALIFGGLLDALYFIAWYYILQLYDFTVKPVKANLTQADQAEIMVTKLLFALTTLAIIVILAYKDIMKAWHNSNREIALARAGRIQAEHKLKQIETPDYEKGRQR